MPKYQYVAQWIQKNIVEGRFQPGQRLPSEQELREQFQVSRQTVRKALEILEKQGNVRSRQGSGTFVVDMEAEEQHKSKRIAVVTTYVDNYIFPQIIQGIEKVVSEHGFRVQIAFTNNRLWKEEVVLKDLLGQSLRGIIIETTKSALPNPNLHLYHKLQEKGIPIVFINSRYPELDSPMVSLQDEMAGRCAVEYLIQKGHKKLGGIFKMDDGQGVRRYKGFLGGMIDNGVRAEGSRILWFDTEDTRNFPGLEEKILARLGGCTGIVCYNDSVAYDVMEILKHHGIAVPRDISVVSIDNTEVAVLGDVGLTSVHHPKERLGEKAGEILLSMIRSNMPGETYEFEARLVERDSVRDVSDEIIEE